MQADPQPFTITSEEARAWTTHLRRNAPYFALVPTDEWITPARVRAIHAECERVAALQEANAPEGGGDDW